MSDVQRELRLLPNAADIFTDTETRALLALVSRRGEGTGVRDIAAQVSRSIAPTWMALSWLRANDLVSWRTNRAATLRAEVIVVPFTQRRRRR